VHRVGLPQEPSADGERLTPSAEDMAFHARHWTSGLSSGWMRKTLGGASEPEAAATGYAVRPSARHQASSLPHGNEPPAERRKGRTFVGYGAARHIARANRPACTPKTRSVMEEVRAVGITRPPMTARHPTVRRQDHGRSGLSHSNMLVGTP